MRIKFFKEILHESAGFFCFCKLFFYIMQYWPDPRVDCCTVIRMKIRLVQRRRRDVHRFHCII